MEANPQISPDGKRIVFSSQRTGRYQVWIAASDGSNQAQLTSLSRFAASPRWAPDGETIVFDAGTDHDSNIADIFVIHPKEGVPRPVVVEKRMQGRPSWSQDGLWIYYFSDQTGANQIWKAPVGGGEPVQLTRKGGYQPLESPDGKYVYYASEREESTIRRVPVDGGEEADILTGIKKPGYGYWDVTSEGIYFVDEAPDEYAESRWVLKLYDFETERISVITDLDQPPYASTVLDVSPDGNWFVYAQIDRSDSDLMLVEDFQ
jgi:Tol biopolymer transport system component